VAHGIRFEPQFGRQAFKIDGRFKFWGGATLATWGGGPGLVEGLYKAAHKAGVKVVYNAWVTDLVMREGRIGGVEVRMGGKTQTMTAGAVVLACGGFEANAEWRTRYLGKGWDLAKVRGSRFNTGDGLAMALKLGAQPRGHWSGAHAVGWERYAADFGDPALANDYERDSYPFSIIINSEGRRFLDEGADFRNYTYAKYGQRILEQPGQFAWQVFDAKVLHLLRPEYRMRHVSKVIADTMEELVEKMGNVDRRAFLKTVAEFNDAVDESAPFDPNIKDGRAAASLEIPKSNWANRLDTGPFHAYNITCGITFTFGGIRISNDAEVIDSNHDVMPGLYAAGEMVGGLFYFNYPGATGLTSGTVFGRVAGRSAGRFARAATA
jgi:tricarballylate dehydrogenase